MFLFAVWYVLFHTCYFLIPDGVLIHYLHHDCITSIAAPFINFLSPTDTVLAHSNTITSAKTSLRVVRGCDGAGAAFLLMAAILAFKTTQKLKAIGIILGLSLIYVINMLRIIGLFFILQHRHSWFLVVHTYLSPTFIVIICAIFFLWWTMLPTLAARTDESSSPI